MPHLFLVISLLLVFALRKSFSRFYLSPTGILSLTWCIFIGLMFFFANDFYLSISAAIIFLLFILAFFLGELTCFIYSDGEKKGNSFRKKQEMLFEFESQIFSNLLIKKIFRKFLLFIGILSFLGSILYLQVFASYFGSIINVLTAGWAVRGALEEIQVPLFTRAILMIGYSSIILTLVYRIVYKEFKWYFFFPYLSILLMGITQAGRAGFMMVLFQVFISHYWSIIYSQIKSRDNYISFSKKPEVQLVASALKLIIVIIIVFVLGDMLRSQSFSMAGETLSQGILSFQSYLFGGIAGFTTYYDSEYLRIVSLGFGRFSFSSLFELLGIYDSVGGIYDNYLRISSKDYTLDVNIFTAFRQLIDDFGIIGGGLFMYISGFFSYKFFRKAINGDLGSIAMMIVIYTILFHSPLLLITVHNAVLVSLFFPFFVISAFRFLFKNIIK
ncbi:MAG TPA: O-antigen polymerase [Sediminibacterium sp.]|uniref:O-antigen polymerase n=1 Tax=Sediminibacterium sp. TaxID=1917865 RepID=UPI0026C10DD4|nr:O-antigen polymerase [Sediminibacterium sp.]HLD53095.1 O-antigen polymerase [Sediminibacterium sp.]